VELIGSDGTTSLFKADGSGMGSADDPRAEVFAIRMS
jgi:hypothetical protein